MTKYATAKAAAATNTSQIKEPALPLGAAGTRAAGVGDLSGLTRDEAALGACESACETSVAFQASVACAGTAGASDSLAATGTAGASDSLAAIGAGGTSDSLAATGAGGTSASL